MISQAISDEQQIRQLEHLSHEAFLEADSEKLDRVLADDFIFIDPDGMTVTKADWMADLASGELIFESIHMEDLQVRTYGDAAVTFGRVRMTGQTGEGSFEGHYCYTAMYIRKDGRWQAVAEQATLLAPQ